MNPYLKAAIWVVIVLAVAFGVGYFFFDVEEVPDHTMAPTMWGGDKILILKKNSLKRGDIAVCENPEIPGQVVTGRVVGIAGDTIAVARNQLRINGEIIHEEAEGPFMYWDRESSTEAFEYKLSKKKAIIGGSVAYLLYDENPSMKAVPKYTVESGYYIMGDNRAGGLDSRTFGEVHGSLCTGKAFFIYSAVKGLGDADSERRTFTFLLD